MMALNVVDSNQQGDVRMTEQAWHLISRASIMLRTALSTSNLYLIVFSACLPLASLAFAGARRHWSQTPRPSQGQMLRSLVKAIIVGAGLPLIAWSCLFLWAIYKSVYNDHHNLVGRLRSVVIEKNVLKEGVRNRDMYIRQLEAGPKVTVQPVEPSRTSQRVAKEARILASDILSFESEAEKGRPVMILNATPGGQYQTLQSMDAGSLYDSQRLINFFKRFGGRIENLIQRTKVYGLDEGQLQAHVAYLSSLAMTRIIASDLEALADDIDKTTLR